MFRNSAYIALGSNKGNKLNNFRRAVQLISSNPQCRVDVISSIYETLPYGNKDQDNFYNAAIEIRTNLKLIELLDFLKDIEKQLGRKKTDTKWGPREIDLDLLFYNDVIYSDDRLTVPHREVTKRDFVLVPLCEIAPGFIHPELNKKICDICIEDSEETIISKVPEQIINKTE